MIEDKKINPDNAANAIFDAGMTEWSTVINNETLPATEIPGFIMQGYEDGIYLSARYDAGHPLADVFTGQELNDYITTTSLDALINTQTRTVSVPLEGLLRDPAGARHVADIIEDASQGGMTSSDTFEQELKDRVEQSYDTEFYRDMAVTIAESVEDDDTAYDELTEDEEDDFSYLRELRYDELFSRDNYVETVLSGDIPEVNECWDEHGDLVVTHEVNREIAGFIIDNLDR